MKKILFFALLLFTSMNVRSQSIEGQWEGSLHTPTQTIPMIFHISKTADGYMATMDSPDQNAKDIRMSHVRFENAVLTVELRIVGMKYTGTLKQDSLIGTFQQRDVNLPLNFVRSQQAEIKVVQPAVDPNAKFLETPITLNTTTGKIYGTLTLPKTFKKGPLALIIAGSGPTDRNGNNPSMTNNAYLKMAHELAEHGIASIRYDKRGIAESAAAAESESTLVFYDYARDAQDWLQLARQDKRFTKLVIIGHSEGSLIGMLAAGKADKFISIAGPGRSIGVVLKEQLAAQPKEFQDIAFPIIDTLTTGKFVEQVPLSMMPLFRPSIQPYMISWLKYDPKAELKKIKVPVLLIQGTTDIQVSVQDAQLLSVAKPKAKLLIIDQMNHILRTAELDRTANLATYNKPELPLAEKLIEGIATFILGK